MSVRFEEQFVEKLVRSEGGFVDGVSSLLGVGTRARLNRALMALQHSPTDPAKVEALRAALDARIVAVFNARATEGVFSAPIVRTLLEKHGIDAPSVMPAFARLNIQRIVNGKVFQNLPLSESATIVQSRINHLTSFYGGVVGRWFAAKDLRGAVKEALEKNGLFADFEAEKSVVERSLKPEARDEQVQKRLLARRTALSDTRKKLGKREAEFVSTSTLFVENSKKRELCRDQARVKLTDHLQKVATSYVAAAISDLEDLIGAARKIGTIEVGHLDRSRAELAELLSTLQVQRFEPGHARMFITYAKQAKAMADVALDSKRGVFADADSVYIWGCECSKERRALRRSLSGLASQVSIIEQRLAEFDKLDQTVQEANARRQNHNREIGSLRQTAQEEEGFFAQDIAKQEAQTQRQYTKELNEKYKGLYAFERCTREATWTEQMVETSTAAAKTLVKTAAAVAIFSLLYDTFPKVQEGTDSAVNRFMPASLLEKVHTCIDPIVKAQRAGTGYISWGKGELVNGALAAHQWWKGNTTNATLNQA